jgi:glycosyltransferase involved in cell wall biosynthesis
MHVVFIATPDLSYVSGSSLSLRYTVEALGRRGVRCTVLCQHAPTLDESPLVEYRELPMPLDYQVITDTTPTSTDLTTCLTQLLTAVIDVADVDVVHAIYGTFTGAAGALACAILGVPLVISTYGRDMTVGAEKDERYRRLMLLSYGHTDLVIASDEATAALAGKDYCGSGTQVCVLPPGTNFTLLRSVARPPARADISHPRLLSVQSSFNKGKGLGVLIDAFATVRKSFPHAGLVVAGHDDTPNARIQTQLLEQVNRLGMYANVDFLGHLEHQRVAQTMAGCHVLVDPRIINSFSSCIYEAMTLAVPVVASDVPCNCDALAGGARGVLTRAGDPDDLARGILTVLTDRQLASDLAAAGIVYTDVAARQMDSSVIAKKLHHLYQNLISARTETLLATPTLEAGQAEPAP